MSDYRRYTMCSYTEPFQHFEFGNKVRVDRQNMEYNRSKTQNNVQVVAYFYDSKGNNVGGPYKGAVNPTILKSLQTCI